MSVINRQSDAYNEITSHKRYLASGQEATAKQQAYLFRDLLDQHSGARLRGGDVTDAFSLVFHGMPWTDLLAYQRGESTNSYYGHHQRLVIPIVSSQASALLGIRNCLMARVLLDMPRERYHQARTMAGAWLASAIQGAPAWHLPQVGKREELDAFTVTLRGESKPLRVLHFISDPMTNAERLWVLDPETLAGHSVGLDQIEYAAKGQDLNDVRDPEERWTPKMKNSKAMVNKVRQAELAYHSAIDEALKSGGPEDQMMMAMGDATEAFNRVLSQALEALWRDTREINGWKSLEQIFAVSDTRDRLMLSPTGGAAAVFEGLIDKG